VDCNSLKEELDLSSNLDSDDLNKELDLSNATDDEIMAYFDSDAEAFQLADSSSKATTTAIELLLSSQPSFDILNRVYQHKNLHLVVGYSLKEKIRRKRNQLLQARMEAEAAERGCTDPMRRGRITVVRQGRAGKSSTIRALQGLDFNPEQPSTNCVDVNDVMGKIAKTRELAIDDEKWTSRGEGKNFSDFNRAIQQKAVQTKSEDASKIQTNAEETESEDASRSQTTNAEETKSDQATRSQTIVEASQSEAASDGSDSTGNKNDLVSNTNTMDASYDSVDSSFSRQSSQEKTVAIKEEDALKKKSKFEIDDENGEKILELVFHPHFS
jgi:hypothetical protein